MKKLILAVACAALFALPALAQPSTGSILDVVKIIHDAMAGPDYRRPDDRPRGPNPKAAYVLNSPLDVVFTNLSNGQAISRRFTVTGYTAPFNRVDLTVRSRGRQSQPVRSTVSADAAGRFGLVLDASQVPRHGTMTIRAQARDSQGNTGPAQVLEVVRR